MENKNNASKKALFRVPEFCPSCQSRYVGARANIVNSQKNAIMVHITCPKCETSVISSISLNNLGVMAVGMLTDISKEDLRLVGRKDKITVDDVLEIHELMEKKGNLSF